MFEMVWNLIKGLFLTISITLIVVGMRMHYGM